MSDSEPAMGLCEMEVMQIVKLALSTLKAANISACLIGEITLNYYNVPRVVHVSTPLAF
jgi:hypothetical protein